MTPRRILATLGIISALASLAGVSFPCILLAVVLIGVAELV